jgi:Cu+-exporting ATPase
MGCCCGGDTKVAITGGRSRAVGAKAEFTVRGMSCGACARRVEKTVSKLAGVREAVADLAASRARVTYDPSLVRLVDIEAAIRELGYETCG